MKKILIMLIIGTMLLSLCGCRRTIESSADELTVSSWRCELPSGMTATLSFCDDIATLRIEDTKSGETEVLEGIYAIDSESFYITSLDFCKTYSFDYEVYCNRAYISYNENKIEFLKLENFTAIGSSFDEQ